MRVSFTSNKKTDAAVENNVRLPYAASKRVFPKVRWILILLIVSAPFIMLLGKFILDWIFVTSPATVWMEKKTINSLEAGTVEKVFYHKGDMVSSDTVMFRVKRKIPENRVEQLALLEAEHDAAIKGAASESVLPVTGTSGISDEIQLANQSVAYYEQARNNTKWLMEKGAATKAELDLAENKLREAKASVAALTAKSATTAVSAATSSVNSVRIAQIEQSINALKKLTEEVLDIKAGQGGKISSIFVNDGQSYSAGEPLAVIVNTEQVHVVTYVDPKDFNKINTGTVAKVKIPSSGRKIKALVEQPPVLADNVPSGISEKIYPTSTRGIQVFLTVLDPLQEQEKIDGLPVVVEW